MFKRALRYLWPCGAACWVFLALSAAAHAQQAPGEEAGVRPPAQDVVQVQDLAPQINETPPEDRSPDLPLASDERYNLRDTVLLSIFNKHAPKRQWTPLYLTTFFTDGWLQPHIAPPATTGGSVRQGWSGLNDVFFNRMIDNNYSYFWGAHGKPNRSFAVLDVETPISRRWMLGMITNYVDATNGSGQPGITAFGDTLIENRFILHETRELTITANLNVRTPTGITAPGDHQMNFSPYLGWYKDLGYKGISFRGLVGFQDPLNGPNSQRVCSFYQTVGLGQTITPHEAAPFGDFTYYIVLNTVESPNTNTFISLTPGIRTHLGRDWFLLLGLDVPVSHNAGYSERFNLQLVKGF